MIINFLCNVIKDIEKFFNNIINDIDIYNNRLYNYDKQWIKSNYHVLRKKISLYINSWIKRYIIN